MFLCVYLFIVYVLPEHSSILPLHNLRHLKSICSPVGLQQIIHEYISRKWSGGIIGSNLKKSHNPVWDIIFMSWKAFCKCCSQSTAVGSGAQSDGYRPHQGFVPGLECRHHASKPPGSPPAPTLPFLTLPLRIRTSWIRGSLMACNFQRSIPPGYKKSNFHFQF